MQWLLTRCAFATMTILLLAGPLAALPPEDVPPAKDVLVTNPDSDPVPVTVIEPVEVAPPPPATHMGQPTEDHVRLSMGTGGGVTCPTGTLGTFRVLSDGATVPGEFVVPGGRSLVLTDLGIPVSEAAGFPWSLGSIVTAHVMISAPGSNLLTTIWRKSAHVDATLALSRQTWLEGALTGGAVIGAGRRICIGAGFGFSSGTNATVSVPNLGTLYGYLVDDPAD